jgi:hypothetical protein
MRVARIELTNIGPFDQAVLEIPPPAEGSRGELVIFEGPNGSGKTTLAQVIACAAEPEQFSGKLQPTGAPLDELSSRVRPSAGKTITSIEHGAQVLRVSDPRTWTKWNDSRPLPESATLIERLTDAATGSVIPLAWAAFAYRGHQNTPVILTNGPAKIDAPPLRGALSFGALDTASAHFGQLLTTLDYEIARASTDARAAGISADRSAEFNRIADARQSMLNGIEQALSSALRRAVKIEFPFGHFTPTILLDGDAIPLALLGEGMRSTFAWLADLLVRLHRVTWANTEISPLEQDFWLILDEIDESLHPTMQMRIVPVLRRLFPNARLYVTTHSPFLVASAGEGWVFSINPDAKRRVNGNIEGRRLEPGQSLEWVVEEVFGAETGIIDQPTREALRAHRADIDRLRRKQELGEEEWRAFLKRRRNLLNLNEQVQTVVAMQEVPVRKVVESNAALWDVMET